MIGANIQPNKLLEFQTILDSHFPIKHQYGISETRLISAIHKSSQTDDNGLLGVLQPGCQLYIADLDTGKRLKAGNIGKIMVKTQTMCKSYLNNSEADEEFFCGEDGFGYTGDIGYYKETGQIIFCDRYKELLRNQNVWFGPGEVKNSCWGH